MFLQAAANVMLFGCGAKATELHFTSLLLSFIVLWGRSFCRRHSKLVSAGLGSEIVHGR